MQPGHLLSGKHRVTFFLKPLKIKGFAPKFVGIRQGCGTTLDAACRLKRQWVGIDISPFVARLVKEKRLKDDSISIYGIPSDMEGAWMLFKKII